jgi:hypothetical protein
VFDHQFWQHASAHPAHPAGADAQHPRRTLRRRDEVLGVLRRARPAALDLVGLCSATTFAKGDLETAVIDLERMDLVRSEYDGGGRIRYRAR